MNTSESAFKPFNNEGGTPTAAPLISTFECNICIEPAVEPVITKCGHLYWY